VTEQVRPRPCPSCPYRRDCPSGIWDVSEYERLRGYDGEIGEQAAAGAFGLFACHSTPALLCAGWAGHRDPADLLAIRIALSGGRLDPAVLDYATDVDLFESGDEAAQHGCAELRDPPPAAREAVRKILRARPDVT
jgi:hypothetical protein